MARLSGRELTVRAWEAQWGREGVWCTRCRHLTPPSSLVVDGRAGVLRCERCTGTLLEGESWLADVARRVPLQVATGVGVS